MFRNTIKSQGLEPFQFPTKIGSLSRKLRSSQLVISATAKETLEPIDRRRCFDQHRRSGIEQFYAAAVRTIHVSDSAPTNIGKGNRQLDQSVLLVLPENGGPWGILEKEIPAVAQHSVDLGAVGLREDPLLTPRARK